MVQWLNSFTFHQSVLLIKNNPYAGLGNKHTSLQIAPFFFFFVLWFLETGSDSIALAVLKLL